MTAFRYPDARILAFTKAPVAGEVKTRLVPPLTEREAVELHIRLVQRTLSVIRDAQLCPAELWCTPACRHPFFEHCRNRYGVTLHDQQGPDLGSRMHRAFGDALKRCSVAVLVGTDCPVLTGHDLASAIDALQNGADAVLNPAEDGGYVLIGLRRAAAGLFTGIDWSSWAVLHQTRSRLRQLGWDWRELDEKWDLDRPADLERLDPDCLPPVTP